MRRQRRSVKAHSLDLRLELPKGHQFQHNIQVASTRPPQTQHFSWPLLFNFSHIYLTLGFSLTTALG